MASPKKSPQPKAKTKAAPGEIELRPDGWRRFEDAIKAAAKAGPLHAKPKKPA